MRKFLIPLLLIVAFLFPAKMSAQSITPAPSVNTGESQTNGAYTLDPVLEKIDDTTPTVTVTVNDSDIPLDAYVCLESDLCIDDDNIREGLAEGNQSVMETASLGLPLNKVDEGTLQRYKFADGKIIVCGDGDKKLKGSEEKYYDGQKHDWWGKMKGEGKEGCKPERDYFHAGKSYVFAIYTKGESSDGEIWALRKVGGFYTNHAFPKIDFTPPVNFDPNNISLKITLATLIDKPNGNKKDIRDRNNYQVQVQAPGYNKVSCGWVKKDEGQKTIEFKIPPKTLQTGKLRVYIKDQVNEDPLVRKVLDGNPLDFPNDVEKIAKAISNANPIKVTGSSICQGGFVYRQYTCNISKVPTDQKLMTTNCELTKVTNPNYDPENPDSPRFIYHPYADDPSKADIKGLLAYFDTLGVNAADTSYPCNIKGSVQKDPSGCKVLDTALGKIPVDPLGFIMKLFSVILSIAGLGALILIVFSGYRLMISRGNPELIKSARETLTAAVVGLLFIVFSLVLLSIVAGNILKIPGFN